MNPGEIYINSMTLTGQNGSFDITNLINLVSVYEDIKLPGTNISLILLDDKNLQDNFPLIGEETLSIDFNTPSLGSFTHTFNIASMNNASPTINQKAKMYELIGVSTEAITNKSTLIQKTYNTNLSGVVSDIVSSFLNSNKPLNVEETQGVQKYIVQNKRPFEAIAEIMRRSASVNNPSSSYMFFENQKGLNYKTIEGMLKDNTVVQFTNAGVIADSIFNVYFRNIISYNVDEAYNVPRKVGQGAFNSTSKVLDQKTLLYSNQIIPSIIKGISSGKFKQNITGSGITNFIPKDMMSPDTFLDKVLPAQRAYLAEADQRKVHVKVWGDSTLTVGTCVYLHLLQNTSDTSQRTDDPVLSGKYLITKLKHVILPPDANPRYTILMECIPQIT